MGNIIYVATSLVNLLGIILFNKIREKGTLQFIWGGGVQQVGGLEKRERWTLRAASSAGANCQSSKDVNGALTTAEDLDTWP